MEHCCSRSSHASSCAHGLFRGFSVFASVFASLLWLRYGSQGSEQKQRSYEIVRQFNESPKAIRFC